jgi:hypothetical protein
MVREKLYIGSKVIIWKNKSEWDDDVVQFMVPQTAILFERDHDTMSEDGYGENYGALYLNADGTASHFQWWAEGEECVLVDNDLIANQDFVYANRHLLETCDGEDEPEDEDEEELPRSFAATVSSFVYNVPRKEMVVVAKKHGVESKGIKHRPLAELLVRKLPAKTIEALIDGEDLPDDDQL